MDDLFPRVVMPVYYAEFSEDRRYRYVWAIGEPAKLSRALLCCGLNPSKADENMADPTITRMVKRADRLGCDGLIMWNAYAFVSTDPLGLYNKAPDFDPIGRSNDLRLMELAPKAQLVVCAWGAHVDRVRAGRAASILKTLRTLGVTPHAFKLNADGTPSHPLYLPYSLKPEPMT